MFASRVWKTLFSGAAILWGYGAGMASAAPEGQADPALTPSEAIEHLLSLQHGLARLDEEETALVEQIRRNPADYVEPLSGTLQLADAGGALDSLETRLRLERALGVARLIGAEHGRDMVQHFFTQISRRVSDLRSVALEPDDPRREALQNALSLRRHALELLGEFRDARAVDSALASLEIEDLASRHVTLQYLAQIEAARDRVRNELRRMTGDPKSPLYRFGPALKTLEALDAAAETKPGALPG